MKSKFLISLLILALLIPLAGCAGGKVTLEVMNPEGSISVTQVAAPRVADLNGKTICEVWQTGLWRGPDTFPILTDLLQKRFPNAKIIPYTEFQIGSEGAGGLTSAAATVAAAKGKGCDAVIVGNGG